MERIEVARYDSPVGELVIGSIGEWLCLCDWSRSNRHDFNVHRLESHLHAEFEEGGSAIIMEAIRQLEEYFAGLRERFDIPILFCGTDFQRRVWMELINIPYGETISYSELARRVVCPKGIRAVASAVGSNPISIIAPCHRIIGSDNTLTGYAGGLDAKRYLLSLEKR